jgi:hypothetical protein
MKFRAVTLLGLCMFLSIHVTALQASEYYVSTSTGSDTYDGGSREKPWATIKYALSRAGGHAGDPARICVAQGTYYEYNLEVYYYVSIYGGYNPATWERNINDYPTVIDGTGAPLSSDDIFKRLYDNCTIDGLTIQNIPDEGVYCSSYAPTISRCTIYNCSGKAIYAGSGAPVIRNNIIVGNKEGIYNSNNGGSTTIVENNLIVFSDSHGIYTGGNMVITNNTIDLNDSGGIDIGSFGLNAPAVLIQNNNITRNRYEGIDVTCLDPSNITIRYNNNYSNGNNYNGKADQLPHTGDISEDPHYVDPIPRFNSSPAYDYDYHLQSTSPLRDKGMNAGAPGDDLDGNPRPRNGRTDIGCYEYQPPPPTPTPTPYPPFEVHVNSYSPSVGGPLKVDVTVPPCGRAFDAWGVIVGQGVVYSFVLGDPASVRRGAVPLTKGISRLPNVYQGCLCNMPAIPAGAEGEYSVIAGLVPAGVDPRGVSDTIPGYADQKQISIGPE